MIRAIQNAIRIPELRKRILFTAFILAVYSFGRHITIPGIDVAALNRFFQKLQEQGLPIGFVDLFTGGSLRRMTLFALGVQPYISASIILQLLTVVVPYFENLAKEGEVGRKKIRQYTRYGTVLLGAIQSLGISFTLENPGSLGINIPLVHTPGLGFKLMTMVTLTTGTILAMWFGEQITERGIGQGISLIIFAGIVSRIPSGVASIYRSLFHEQTLNLIQLLIFIALMVAVIMGTIYITLAVRKIPVQYARRVIGRRIYGGQMTHIPLRVNAAGVIPIIFAITLLQFPMTLASLVPLDIIREMVAFIRQPAIYYPIYAALIIFFTYFYTAVQINPTQMAENLRKYGGFIPGIRPGAATAHYIERTLDRITLPGAFFLAAIAILPAFVQRYLGVQVYFGGTPVLIVVGVALDTMQQVEAHLLMRNYEGFLKGIRLRGRRGR
ncbi:preprotein translocase subunit SecY [Candidatus Poribacteria bacterium]|nr:MAG: preprotein translocase subunit SecY [Candidatus Poribacteria bacterium]